MATTFPTTIDTLTNPTATDKVSVVSHADQHANANDGVEALQAKVGADSSAVTTSHDYKLGGVTGSDKAASLTGSETLTNKTLTTPVISSVSNTGVVTLPTATTTLIGDDTTDTLTNKTFDANGTGNSLSNVDLTADVIGATPVANGGTGQITQVAGFDALSPTTTKGDVIASDGTNNVRIPVGTDNQVLVADSGESAGVKWASNASLGLTKVISNTTPASVTAESETNLWQFQLDANSLSTANVVKVTAIFSDIDFQDDGSMILRVSYGATELGSITLTGSNSGAASNRQGIATFYLFADGSTSAQKGMFTASNSDAACAFLGSSSQNRFAVSEAGTATEDSTTNLNITLTAEQSEANQNITFDQGVAELIS